MRAQDRMARPLHNIAGHTPDAAQRPRVVIVGAGFAGLWAARALAHRPVELTLIDRNNHHVFLPLLYQVAAAELEPEDIAYPIRSIMRKWPHAQFVLGEATRIDFTARTVEAGGLSIGYDFLILAAGSITDYFGVAGAMEYSFPLKTLEQAMVLRNHILTLFEQAVHEPDADRRREMLTFAIVGGGPTGVEFAGALAELVRGPLASDFPTLDLHDVHVVLVEAMNRPLTTLPEDVSGYVARRLRAMGVELLLGSRVNRVTTSALHFKEGAPLETRSVVWTAGVRGVRRVEAWGLQAARNGQVLIQPTLQSGDHPDVYIVGDLARAEEDGKMLPMIAPVAMQQGDAAAKNVLQQIAGDPPSIFRYHDPGMLVTLGRNAAVACLGKRCFTGFFAWLLWLGVHIFKLIGFRNRLLVLINWGWDYLFYERAVRLILPDPGSPEYDRKGED